MNDNEKYLPIGSVVLLNGGTKKAMITGFCSIAEEDTKKMYDYTGCVYPEGFLDYDQICLFDHSQIEKVYHIGYIDEEEEMFKKELLTVAERFESGKENTFTFFNEYTAEDEEEYKTNNNIENNEDIILHNIQENKVDKLEYL